MNDTFDTDPVATTGSTFSNGDLTVLGASGYTLLLSGIAQTREGKRAGKWYVEFTCDAVSGNVDGVGLVASYGVGLEFLGTTNTSAPNTDCGWGFFTNSNVVHLRTTQTSVNNATWTASDVLGLAIDLDNAKLWFRINTGSWIGTTGTPDPETNTSGFDISNILISNFNVYPAVNLSGSAAQFSANFGDTSFTGSVPSGFTAGWTNTETEEVFGTFATSGRGAAVQTPPLNDKAVSKYTATFTGSVDRIVIPFAGLTAVANVSDIKGVIYDDTGAGGLPGTLLGVSSNTISSAVPAGEIALAFSGVDVTAAADYWFGVVSDQAPTVAVNVTLCPPQTGGIAYNTGSYASPTDPFGTSPSTANYRYPVKIYLGHSGDASITLDDIGISATGTIAPGAGLIGLAEEIDEALALVPRTRVQFIIYAPDIVALAPFPVPATLIPAPQAVQAIAAFNWTPLTDIAGVVTGDEREALAGTGRVMRAESGAVAARQRASRQIELQSLYHYEVDALGRAQRMVTWAGRGLRAFQVTFTGFANRIELGMLARIDTYPRFNLAAGFLGTVVAWAEVPASGQVTIVLIG